jgi:hypothetical protein
MSYGITSESAALQNLIAGLVKMKTVPVKANEGALAVGQVLEYDATTHNYIKYAGDVGASPNVVVAEAVTIGAAGGFAVCIVQGEVNKNALDATAKADSDIEAALLMNGIIAANQQV